MRLKLGVLVWFVCVAAGAQTGVVVPALPAYDQLMNRLLARYQIPGGAIALTKDGRLVFARGYGYADAQRQTPVQPDSLFRIASLSKLVTAVTILHLVEQGKLALDQPAFALLPDLQAPAGATEDPRLGKITIRHLLTHSGGWDDSSLGSGFDPMFESPVICAALHAPAPASTENIIRYMRGQPLDFDPGTHFAYSNFGYAVLGRIIERVTGMSYEEYVRTHVLAPMGISRMRIGQSLPQGRLPGEVQYASAGFTASIFPDFAGTVPWAYGGWYLEAMDAHGGWVASTVDYAKFLNAIEGRRGPRFLSGESVAAMTARPAIPDWAQSSYWYGFGLLVRPAGRGANWWHSGSLDGTATYQVRTANGFDWVVFFNSRPATAAGQNSLFADIDAGLWNAYQQVSSWPAGDQFSVYPDSDPAGAAALPAITTREGVVNAATQDRGMVSGSWVLLRGVNLSQTTRTWSSSDIVNGALPTSLDGVSVRINGQPAFVYFISPGAIEAQAPAKLSPGWVTVEAVNHGVSTEPVLAHAVESAPGAFTYSGGEGRTLAVATEPDGTLVGDAAGVAAVRRAAPGDTITIYASGLMPSAAGMLAPVCPRLGAIEVTIGGQTAIETAATLAAPGLFQIHAVVPEVAADDQPLVIRTGGAESPAGVTIAVGR